MKQAHSKGNMTKNSVYSIPFSSKTKYKEKTSHSLKVRMTKHQSRDIEIRHSRSYMEVKEWSSNLWNAVNIIENYTGG